MALQVTCVLANMRMPSLADKIVSGAFWTVGMRLAIRLLSVISIVILARLLMPEDFGIVAKAAMIASFLELIGTFGLEAALIQNQKATSAHYNTVWTLHAIRGAAIGIVLAVVAYPAASFFREPALNSILYFYALAFFFRGIVNVGTVDFRKDLEFDKDFRFNLYRKLAGFFATIIVAFISRSYWAFVIGVLAASITAVTASFLMSPYRPRISLEEFRSLFHYSKWVFGFAGISAVSKKLDTFILGRFATVEGLGQYTVANEVSGAASTEIAMPVARAAMPGLAKLNNEPERFRSTYTNSVLVLLFVAIPAGFGVGALAEDITLVVLGNKWAAAAPLIEVLAFFGIVRAVFSVSTSAFMSSGRVDVLAKLSIASLVLRIVFLASGFYVGGILGLARGVLFSAIIHMVISVLVQHYIGLLAAPLLVSRLWRVIVAAVTMFVSIRLVSPKLLVLGEIVPVVELLTEVVFGATVYVAIVALLWLVSSDRQGPEVIVFGYLKQHLNRRGESCDS